MEADFRDECIRRVARGKTFAEVGGLWGTVNERVSVARRFGATELTMIDITVPDGELWRLFGQRMQSFGVKDCHCISADVCQVTDLTFDVLHCSGVLYHHSNPMSLIHALRRLTRHNMVLTSAITRPFIENECGIYRIPPSGIVFVPL